VAETISRRLRLSDVFARIGGDEFAVLLPHTSAGQAQQLARALSERVKANSPGSVCIGNWMAFGRLTMVLDLDEACEVRYPPD